VEDNEKRIPKETPIHEVCKQFVSKQRIHREYSEDCVSILTLHPIISVKTVSGYPPVKRKECGYENLSVWKSALLSDVQLQATRLNHCSPFDLR